MASPRPEILLLVDTESLAKNAAVAREGPEDPPLAVFETPTDLDLLGLRERLSVDLAQVDRLRVHELASGRRGVVRGGQDDL